MTYEEWWNKDKNDGSHKHYYRPPFWGLFFFSYSCSSLLSGEGLLKSYVMPPDWLLRNCWCFLRSYGVVTPVKEYSRERVFYYRRVASYRVKGVLLLPFWREIFCRGFFLSLGNKLGEEDECILHPQGGDCFAWGVSWRASQGVERKERILYL